jgi:hypothetical protein
MTKVIIEQTPSEKIINSKLPKTEVIDKDGRRIKLRMPDLLDQFDLSAALPKDLNEQAVGMAMALGFISSIDDIPFNTPREYSQVRSGIKKIGNSGIEAILSVIKEMQNSEKTEVDDIKK